MYQFFTFLLLTLLLTNSGLAQNKSIDERVTELLARMTLTEKVGQMNQYNGFWDATGPAPKGDNSAARKYEHLRNGQVGSMLNVHGVDKVRALQKIAVEETRLGIPLIFGFDVIHGYKTLAPIPLAEAASWDLAAIEQSARVAATEAASVGLNWTFAPMVDISRDARWGRVMEGAGEDTYLGSQIAVARVKGFQGDDLAADNTIAACAKHFAGYGFAEAGREYNTADIGLSTLYNVVLPPFKAAVDANVQTIMNSFNILNGIPATGDKFLQRDILKGEWKFPGFVISDWGSVRELEYHGYASDLKNSAELAAIAGSDMDMESSAYLGHLEQLVTEGKVKMSVVDEAVSRILRVKFALGLFDDPYKYCNEDRQKNTLYHADHQADVLEMAKKSIVLLKNENNLLPLAKDQKKVAVIGELAAEKNSPLGSWRLASDNGTAVSVLEGLAQYDLEVTYATGVVAFPESGDFLHTVPVSDDTTGMAAAVALAKASEVVIMVLGEHGFQSGEGRSRTRLNLPGAQQALLEAVHAANPNVILVLNNGRPLALPWAAENIPTIVEAWQLGSQAGNAIAEILVGDYNPSGKLPMTFPRSVGQVPIYYNKFSTGRMYPEPIVFWSSYRDESNDPLYPFGHGLSYATFKYSNLKVDATNSDKITVSVDVKNTGKVAGEEVTQLYIHDVSASVVRPIQELKAFEKYNLQPGQTKTVRFTLTDKQLGFMNNQGEFVVEPGVFRVMVGTSSAEFLEDKFTKK
ncbi:MAG: beta-glucosidase BglX [Saprospiraceae bacterium]